MCGITGLYAFNEIGKSFQKYIDNSTDSLSKRGPDSRGTFIHNNIALGHRRLSVIDVSDSASQPFSDNTGRFTIIFNGEFYNYKDHKAYLENKGYKFKTQSDTEVLLYLYIEDGISCLEKINGFFAFSIYDQQEESLFIARDRMGIKPLHIYQDNDKLIFASELKAIFNFNIPKEINYSSLYTYLQLNYLPTPFSIINNVYKLEPGSYIFIKNNIVEQKKYFQINYNYEFAKNNSVKYEDAQNNIKNLLEESILKRLVSDVPLGAFLSGGIDSSIIVGLASRHKQNIKTFTIGYKDEPFFDESSYANIVAKKFNTDHTVFELTNNELYSNLHDVLEYIDEPFADSSALAVHILSMHTRKHVTVALSGDGADEIFAGYNKYLAEYNALKYSNILKLASISSPVFNLLPQSRNSNFSNKVRQINRFLNGIKLPYKERYWLWCSLNNESDVENLLLNKFDKNEYYNKKNEILNLLKNKGINDVLYADCNNVLSGDMLVKTDLMSMANSLEVRVPFLDYNLVNYVFSLPDKYKIDGKMKKKILQDSFRNILPNEIYNRPKHGFEVPLLKWLRTDLQSMINDDLLSENFIKEQNIFNFEVISNMKKKLFSNNPGDIQGQIWGLIVFQYWFKKWMM